MDNKKITVIVADDTLIAREGLRAIFETVPNIKIIGEAETAQETPRKVRELLPDLLLMDLNWMGDSDAGWTIIQEIKSSNPKVKIIVLTAYEELIKNARRAGADAALTKTFSREQLIKMIYDVISREETILPLEHEDSYREKFTQRERDVLELLVKGVQDKEIAQTLGIAENTAKNHVKNILSKLGVRNRTEASNKAHDLGLFT